MITTTTNQQKQVMTYQVTFERDAKSFWDANANSLLAHESEYNLMIGITLGIISAERVWGELSCFTVRHGSEIVGQAMHTGGDKPLILTRMSTEAVDALVDATIENNFFPERVSGPAETAEYCASVFATRRGAKAHIFQRQGIYELKEVIWPTPDGGKLIGGTAQQRELTLEWAEHFVRECFPEEAEPKALAEDMVKNRLGAGHVYFWQTAEGDIVSMAGRNRESPNTATISWVYTPPEKRGRGYARSVVAHLSQLWLDRGKKACNLFTNLANPSSNKAYVSVGYEQLLEARIYSITKN